MPRDQFETRAMLARACRIDEYDLLTDVRRYRERGLSWSEIANLYHDMTGIAVSRYSLRSWAPDPEGWDNHQPPGPRPAWYHDRKTRSRLTNLESRLRAVAAALDPDEAITQQLVAFASTVAAECARPSDPRVAATSLGRRGVVVPPAETPSYIGISR